MNHLRKMVHNGEKDSVSIREWESGKEIHRDVGPGMTGIQGKLWAQGKEGVCCRRRGNRAHQASHSWNRDGKRLYSRCSSDQRAMQEFNLLAEQILKVFVVGPKAEWLPGSLQPVSPLLYSQNHSQKFLISHIIIYFC